MSDIRAFIRTNLLEPLKSYPTVIQGTMLELIVSRLQTLYEYTLAFPEIVSPNKNRLDVLKVIADQFSFDIRSDADIQEQINILENILYVYRKRGSVDTIENMWNYYGGKLPKDVKVVIPYHNVFRYSVSKLSGTHAFTSGASPYVVLDTEAPSDINSGAVVREIGSTRDRVTTGVQRGSNIVYMSTVDGLTVGSSLDIGGVYVGGIKSIYIPSADATLRSGVYEIRLTNNTYPIADLREFLMKELVAAGNQIYFTNAIHMNLLDSDEFSNYYKYSLLNDEINMSLDIQLEAISIPRGSRWSKSLVLSGSKSQLTLPDLDNLMRRGHLSGNQEIFIELTNMLDLDVVRELAYNPYLGLDMNIAITTRGEIEYTEDGDLLASITDISEMYEWDIFEDSMIYIEPEGLLYCTARDSSLSVESNLSNSPGYFILGESLLGEEVI